MVKNFFIVTFRNLLRNGLYTIINIGGLSVGLVCSILILLWVDDEVSFDRFLPKVEKLFQVWVHSDYDGKINSWQSMPLPTYEAIKTRDSNIKNSVVMDWGGDHLLTVGETRIFKRGYWASKEFFEMFRFPFVKGEASQVMADPKSIVISEALAEILFGEEDPLGQIVRVDDESSLQVTGIIEDVPGNSSFQFDYIMPWEHREATNDWVARNKTNWGNYSFQVFVELFDGNKEIETEHGIKDLLTDNGETDIPRQVFLHPMLRWRFHSNFENGKEAGGMGDYVQLFSAIAVLILIIACINFMNLATARSEKRAKEVGIRKSLGSNRTQLIFQFFGESLVISLVSFTLAILMAQLALPAFNELVDKQLVIDYTSGKFWIFSGLVIFFTGVVSGSYPALYLSAFKPVKTLKGSLAVGKAASTPRKVLVVLQFGFSIFLMISTVVIVKQISLVQNRDLGYQQENLISVGNTDDIAANYEVLKRDLLQSGVVKAVTRSNSPITEIWSNNFLGWPGKPESQKVIFTTVATEYDYCKTMGIEILMGRDFSKDYTTDTSAIVINRAALDLMQLEDPIGTPLDLWGGKRTLIGVIENTLMGSPYNPIKPLFMVIDPDWINAISVRLNATDDLPHSLKVVEEIFQKHNPAYPFDYSFADVEFQKKFTTIEMTKKLAGLFSVLAVLITGLGLFGLASYMAEQRTKEIGIRKVLGASIRSLISLMSRDFSKLVVVSFVIAAPLGWYLVNKYLERYPVHTDVSWWIFPMIGLGALVFALLIVSNQAWRVAAANPAKALRDE